MFALQELNNGGIFRHTNRTLQHLDTEMKIAQSPSHARGLLRVRHRNLKHGFRGLLNGIVTVAFTIKMIAVLQRLLEVETEFATILRHAPPPTLGQRQAIDLDMDVSVRPIRMIMFWFRYDDEIGHN